jgi:predicted N-acetyltransferase YhbS
VVEVRDHSNAVMGGLWGHTGYGGLFTQLQVVPAALRGQGVGAAIMQLAEREAMARGPRSTVGVVGTNTAFGSPGNR